jgi:hypothetical protein
MSEREPALANAPQPETISAATIESAYVLESPAHRFKIEAWGEYNRALYSNPGLIDPPRTK